MMKFGIFLGTQHPETDDMSMRLRDLREQVREARQAGFDSIWAGQHFLAEPMAMFQPMPVLGLLAADAEGMTLGTNILVLPLLNPVQVAEDRLEALGLVGRRGGELGPDGAGLHAGHDGQPGGPGAVVRDPVDDAVAERAELLGGHWRKDIAGGIVWALDDRHRGEEDRSHRDRRAERREGRRRRGAVRAAPLRGRGAGRPHRAIPLRCL